MLNRKLLEVLSRLSPEMLDRLRVFLGSDYFNSGRNAAHLLRLYDYIAAHGADEKAPALSKETVSKTLFPQRVFREKEKTFLDTLTSELFALVKRFMAQQEWERDDAAKQELFSLLRFYRDHDLEERYWQTVAAVRKAQAARTFRDADYYRTEFALAQEIADFKSFHNSFEDDLNLEQVHYTLDTWYNIVKLEYLCALYYQHRGANIPFNANNPLSRAAVERAAETQDAALINLYGLMFELLNKQLDDEDVFRRFEAMLKEHKASIPADKYRDLMAYYRNFWTARYYKLGDYASRRALFELHQAHFEQGYFHINGKALVVPLRVMIVFALKMEQFDWAKKVLDAYTPERICGTRFPAEAQRLNYGEYYFYLKAYDAALECVVYKPFENPHFSILADVLLVKIYYETRNDLLEYRIKALYQKVRRTKISAGMKKRYFTFLHLLDRISRHGWEKNSPRKSRIAEDIRSATAIIDREWLLQILN